MKEYFVNNFNKFYGYIEQINQSSFWDNIGKIIKNVGVQEIVSVFSIFWQNNEHVSQMLQELIDT